MHGPNMVLRRARDDSHVVPGQKLLSVKCTVSVGVVMVIQLVFFFATDEVSLLTF